MVTTNQKSTIDTHTKKGKGIQTQLKLVIKLQEKRIKEEGQKKNTCKNKSKTIKKMAMRTNILIITLNINNFIAPIKRL